MNKDPGGGAAPAGGFQDLGWYSGYQYYNGSFAPQAGMIHPNSPQQGAGQAVSPQVNAQTNPNNQAYIDAQNAKNGTGGGVPSGGGGGGASGTGIPGGIGGLATPTPAIDLPGLYKSLSEGAGITDLEKQLTDKQMSYNDATSKINDNPFLSEANRVGRIQKLTTDYNNSIKTVQDTLAMKKADVQTQLDLATKQYDINSQAAKDALSKFDSLLNMGALDNASGSDIASLTTSTGLSSTMIQNAINYTKQKNTPTSTISFDDGTNQGFAIINPKTGEIISKQTVAASKPTKTSGGGGGSSKAQQAADAQAAILSYTQDRKAQAAASPEDFITLLLQNYPLSGLSLADAKSIRKVTKQ